MGLNLLQLFYVFDLPLSLLRASVVKAFDLGRQAA
jgi:hypothetical protein